MKDNRMEDKLKQAFGHLDKMDEKSLGYLIKALERNNQQGFDYLEFKLALFQLKKMEMTGELAVKSAFATASAMGVDKAHILQSLDRYKVVLQQERSDFDKALAAAMNRKIEARKKDIDTLEAKIDEFKKEIERIEHAIGEGAKRIQTARNEISAATGELEQAEKTFHKTYEVIKAEMDGDRELILKIS
ncbi:MAG: hypothetical protein K9I85_08420 [Saprospiraceae bacterium]|nr:hypothetical protein [Saprospiraceae bacterium]